MEKVNGHDHGVEPVDEPAQADQEQAVAAAQAAVNAAPVVDPRPQTTFPSVSIEWLDPRQCAPGQKVLIIQNAQQVLLFPMPVEYAQALCQKGLASAVKVATPADAKAAAQAMGLPR
jgi:hypothetical protein